MEIIRTPVEMRQGFPVVGHVFQFSGDEINTLKRGIKPLIKRIEKQIKNVQNNPLNEGQVTFEQKEQDLFQDIKFLESILEIQ